MTATIFPSAPFSVHPATIADAKQIATVHVKSWQTSYVGQLPQSYLDNLSIDERTKAWQENLTNPKGKTFVVIIADEIVGFSSCGASRDDDASTSTGELMAIYLLESAKRLGAGKELWEQSRISLEQSGFSEVTVWVLDTNERARRFYEKAGFLLDGRQKSDIIGSKECLEVRYRCKLSGTVSGS